jgi:hypothetical protein
MGYFTNFELYERMVVDFFGNKSREERPIYGKGFARGHCGCIRGLNDERIHNPQLLFEETCG